MCELTSQNAVPIAINAACDPDFDILSFRYLKNKDGTIIRYRNFKLRFETLSSRVKTLGSSLRTPELSEVMLDIIAMLEGTSKMQVWTPSLTSCAAQLLHVLYVWGKVIAKAQDGPHRDSPEASIFIKAKLDVFLHHELDSLYDMEDAYLTLFTGYKPLFTDKTDPCICPFCTRAPDAVTCMRENAVTYHSDVRLFEFRSVFSDIDWSDVPQILV